MAENILILSMTRMGDLIQTTPLINGLKENHPSSKITLLVTSDFASTLPLIQNVDDSVVINLRQFDEERNWEDLSWVKVYRYLEGVLNELKEKKFDLLVNLSHSKFSALMVRYLEVKDVVGFYCDETGNRMTGHPWMEYFGMEVFNRIYSGFNLVEMFSRSGGVDVRGRAIRVAQINNQDSIESLVTLNKDEVLIGFQAGSSLEDRRWPVSSFSELADMLIDKLNARILIFGVESESKVADQIVETLKNKDRVTNLAGKTSLNELSGLLQKCEYLVTNDTGTMHLAASLNTNIVGLFFAHAHPYETAPFSPGHIIFQARMSCAPCSYGVHCNNIVCIDKVQPSHVFSSIENHINRSTWSLPIDFCADSELNVFETVYDSDKNLRLRPLLRYRLGLTDLFRSAYTLLWRHSLDKKIEKLKNEYLIECTWKDLEQDYDCSSIKYFQDHLKLKLGSLDEILNFAQEGKNFCGEIIRGLSEGNGSFQKVRQVGEKIAENDKRIETIGFTNPEVRPLTEMFSKRKESLKSHEVFDLSLDTRKLYAELIDECETLTRILNNFIEYFSNSLPDQSSHNSIKVAVPGR